MALLSIACEIFNVKQTALNARQYKLDRALEDLMTLHFHVKTLQEVS